MASVNRVILLGNIGREPETRYMLSGEAICNLSVATTDKWKDKSTGEQKENCEWHRVVLFGKLAEIANKYLTKGSSVYIEGKLKTDKYIKDGVETYSTKIVASNIQMLGGKKESSNDDKKSTAKYASKELDDDPGWADRIPF